MTTTDTSRRPNLQANDISAEEAAIGSLLIDATAIAPVRATLAPADFFITKNQWVCKAIYDLHDRGITPDLMTVTGELGRLGKLIEIGGVSYVSRLLDVPSALHVNDYVAVVLERSAERKHAIALLAASKAVEANDLTEAARILQGIAAGQQQKQRYTLHSASEALQPQPPTEWIIEKLFSAGSVSIIAGKFKSKKTFAVLDLAVACALHSDWLGLKTSGAPVLIVDEESGPRRMLKRLHLVQRGHDVEKSIPVYFTSLASFDPLSADDMYTLRALIQQIGARLIIFDALIDLLIHSPNRSGNVENDSVAMQAVFHSLREVAEDTQAAILVVDHNNRANEYRGSSAKPGAVDCMIEVTSAPKSERIDFKIEVARDTEPFEFSAIANFSEDSFNLSPTEPVKAERKLNKSQEYVMRYLTEHGASLLSDIMDRADQCSANAARQAIYSLVPLKQVRRVDAGGPGTTATYALVHDEK